MCKYPDIEVELLSQDGNAFNLIGLVCKGLRQGGADSDEVAAFQAEAMAGDYDHVLQTCMAWVSVQ